MKKESIKKLLLGVKSGAIPVEKAMQKLKSLPFEDIDFAKIDHHRSMRKGYPEVIFCQGKTKAQIIAIMKKMLKYKHNILATRAAPDIYKAVKAAIPAAKYHETARIISVDMEKTNKQPGTIAVITAGTSDIPVAEEAAITAEKLGNEVVRLYDVGVAGIHRLFGSMEPIMNANVLIVVAGMEGALPSVVGGLVDKPVIAVPTSVGYGASFGGISPLLTMLNSCASGIGVVNIDNGFGAGYLASVINRLAGKGWSK
jgi:NCAIR mutase (PurE)-related protein